MKILLQFLFIFLLAFVAIGLFSNKSGTAATEARASEVLREIYPHNVGFTFGVSCYAPPNWCHATVIHPKSEPILLSIYCGSDPCKIVEK